MWTCTRCRVKFESRKGGAGWRVCANCYTRGRCIVCGAKTFGNSKLCDPHRMKSLERRRERYRAQWARRKDEANRRARAKRGAKYPPPPENRDAFYHSATEAARAAGVTQPTISRWIASGRLPAVRVVNPGGGRPAWWIEKAAL